MASAAIFLLILKNQRSKAPFDKLPSKILTFTSSPPNIASLFVANSLLVTA